MRLLHPVVTSIILGATLSACGSSSNLNKMIWSKDDKAGDTLYSEARVAYDRGEFEKAESLAQKLLSINPDNESAAVLLGYSYLSHGGMDPFRLAREIIALNTTSSTTPSTAMHLSDEQLFGEAAEMRSAAFMTAASSSTSSSSSNDASDTLAKLSSALLNLSRDDKRTLTATTYSTGLFAAAPIYVPVKVSDSIRTAIPTLKYMNMAMKAVCRFVNDEAKVESDSRDNGDDCTAVDFERKNAAKSHFLWAFSHLTEALVFQSVLLISTVNTEKSNFQVAVDELNGATFEGTSGFSTFVENVEELRTAINEVFDTSDDSMLTATLRDLTAVENAFDQLVGLPDDIKTKITGAMEKINEVANKLNDATNVGQAALSDKSKALKGQMTAKFSKTVGSKIAKATESQAKQLGIPASEIVQSNANLPASAKKNLDTMCNSYQSLAEGMDPDTAEQSKPEACTSLSFKK